MLGMGRGDASTAAQHFGRSVSIFDMLGDRYRSARAHYELGRAYAIAQPERAAEHLTRAVNIFRELGAHLNLRRAEEAAAALDQTTPQQLRKRETVVQLLTLRLAEAVASRELLLRELAAVVRQENSAARVIIIEPDEGDHQRVVIAHGCPKKESEAWAEDYAKLKNDSGGEAFAKKHNVRVVSLSPSNAPPATLLISPRDRAELAGGLSLDPLLRAVERGMDVCALRVRTRTGAVKDSAGVIRTAVGGTLFLDEVGDLPLDVQPKLLRFLQEGEIQPLGEQQPIKVDVRIIAATNTDLEEMVAQGRFREDLYYRLNVIRLRVPPLRERRSEIPTIVNYYVNHYAAKFGRRDIQIEPQAIDLLMVAEWPGNVRQLCNEMQRVIARAEDGTLITPEHLSPELRHMSSPTTPPGTVTPIGAGSGGASMTVPIQDVTLADALAEVERRMIAEALRKHNGNIARAARELGLTRRGLYLKLERHAMSASA